MAAAGEVAAATDAVAPSRRSARTVLDFDGAMLRYHENELRVDNRGRYAHQPQTLTEYIDTSPTDTDRQRQHTDTDTDMYTDMYTALHQSNALA